MLQWENEGRKRTGSDGRGLVQAGVAWDEAADGHAGGERAREHVRLVQEEDERRAREQLVRAYLPPERERVLLRNVAPRQPSGKKGGVKSGEGTYEAVDGWVLLQELIEDERGEEDDRVYYSVYGAQ